MRSRDGFAPPVGRLFVSALVVLALSSNATAAVGTLYAATGAGPGIDCGGSPSSLYTLDPATGAATLVAAITVGGTQVRHVTGLAVHPSTGTLYGVMNSQDSQCSDFGEATLLQIDTATGVATVIGSQGSLDGQFPDISFDPFGTLYAWNESSTFSSDDLFEIDISTGIATLVGESSIGTSATGLAADSSGRLYVKTGSQLFQLDHSSGLAFGFMNLSAFANNMLAFNENGVLYTGLRTSGGFTLQVIDRATGVVTDVGSNTVTRIAAIAFDLGVVVPPPVADLSLSKSVDHPTPAVGSTVLFTIEVANAGPAATSGVLVRDQLPAGYSYVSDDSGGSYDSSTGIWQVGALAASTSDTLTITASVTSVNAFTNVAEVTAADTYDPDSVPGSGNTGSDTYASVTPDVFDPAVDVALDLSVKGGLRAGSKMKDFTVTLTNAGVNTVVVSTQHLAATVNGSGAFVSCKSFSATLATGRSTRVRCTYFVANAGVSPGASVTFAATVDYPLDSNAGNDSASQVLVAN